MLEHILKKEDGDTTLPAIWREFNHLIFASLFGFLAIAVVALASRLLGEPSEVFTREPQVVLKGSFYVGSFSNLGGLIWFSTAAILSFAVTLKPENRMALILAALVTWALGLDDIFMFHEKIYPKLHISNTMLYILYFGTIGVIVFRYYRQLSRSTLIGIAIAVFFWIVSAALDRYFNDLGQLEEDGSKFVGIAVWAAVWIRQAYYSVSRLVRSSS
jgi:hypothetical protein